jgi:Xaa-Pro aminopeptidase
MFSVQTYQDRRAVLQSNVASGILLFLGNIENPVNFEHNPYYFRQDSTYLYYFGIQEPRIAAIIDIDENKTIIFGDELSIDDIVWMGRQETLKEKSEIRCTGNFTLCSACTVYSKSTGFRQKGALPSTLSVIQ